MVSWFEFIVLKVLKLRSCYYYTMFENPPGNQDCEATIRISRRNKTCYIVHLKIQESTRYD